MASNLPLQLIQEKGAELATEIGSPGQGGPTSSGQAVGELAGRPLLNCAVDVVDVATDGTHRNLSRHLNLVVTPNPKSYCLVVRGLVKSGDGHVDIVAPLTLERQRGFQTTKDHIGNVAAGSGRR